MLLGQKAYKKEPQLAQRVLQCTPRQLKGPLKFERPRPLLRIHAPRRPKDTQRHQKGAKTDPTGSFSNGFVVFVDDILMCFSHELPERGPCL